MEKAVKSKKRHSSRGKFSLINFSEISLSQTLLLELNGTLPYKQMWNSFGHIFTLSDNKSLTESLFIKSSYYTQSHLLEICKHLNLTSNQIIIDLDRSKTFDYKRFGSFGINNITKKNSKKCLLILQFKLKEIVWSLIFVTNWKCQVM